MTQKYDRQGNLLEMAEWARLFEDKTYCRIAETILPDGKRVSTVWLGLDHQVGNGPPLIFETMVFSDGEFAKDQDRYSTEAEAIAGHKAMGDRWSKPEAGRKTMNDFQRILNMAVRMNAHDARKARDIFNDRLREIKQGEREGVTNKIWAFIDDNPSMMAVQRGELYRQAAAHLPRHEGAELQAGLEEAVRRRDAL